MITKQFITKDIVVCLTPENTLLGIDIHAVRAEIWRNEYTLAEGSKLMDVVEVAEWLFVITVAKDYGVSLLNDYTGELTWTVTVNGWLDPESITGTNDILILTDRKNYRTFIQAIDAKSGRRLWDFGMGGHGGGFDPIIVDNRVYVGAADHMETYQDADRKIYPIRLFCLDLLTGEIIWASREYYPYAADHHRQLPLLSKQYHPERGGIVCVDAGDGIQHILNNLTGELRWIYDTNTLVVTRY